MFSIFGKSSLENRLEKLETIVEMLGRNMYHIRRGENSNNKATNKKASNNKATNKKVSNNNATNKKVNNKRTNNKSDEELLELARKYYYAPGKNKTNLIKLGLEVQPGPYGYSRKVIHQGREIGNIGRGQTNLA